MRKTIAKLLFRWRVFRCRRQGHLPGPLLVGPKYVAVKRAWFDVGQYCPRCGGAVRLLAVAYTWKAHRALHRAVQARYRPAGRQPSVVS